jgi:hypothetical protein
MAYVLHHALKRWHSWKYSRMRGARKVELPASEADIPAGTGFLFEVIASI